MFYILLNWQTEYAKLEADHTEVGKVVADLQAKKEGLESDQALVEETGKIAVEIGSKLGEIRTAATKAKEEVEDPDEDEEDIPILRRMSRKSLSPIRPSPTKTDTSKKTTPFKL